MTPAQAGAVNATTYPYYAQSPDLTQWEVGLGVYTVSSTTLARTSVLFSSNSNAKVTFTVIPAVAIDARAEDFTSIGGLTGAVGLGNSLSTSGSNLIITNRYQYLAGLTPAKLSSTVISVNPGSFSDSGGVNVYSTANVLTADLSTATIGNSVASAVVAAGGTIYAVNDVLTVVGGTGSAAKLTVATVSSGVVTAVTITAAGNYTVFPTSPVSVTGGTGSGATFTLTASTLPVGGMMSGALSTSGATTDGTDVMLYMVTRNSDGLVALVGDSSNVYSGALLATISNGSNSWSTGGPTTGFWNNNKVRLTTTGTFPTGFAANTDYFVVSESNGQLSTSFGLSATLGGTAITATSTFSGAIRVVYGVQDHLNAIFGAGVWTVQRRIRFAFLWNWATNNSGAGWGGIPDFQPSMGLGSGSVQLTNAGQAAALWRPLSNGTATSFTDVDCGNSITPAGKWLSNLNRRVWLAVTVTASNTSQATVYVRAKGSAAFLPAGNAIGVAGATITNIVPVQTDSQGFIQYEVLYTSGTTGVSVNLDVIGWDFSDPS